MSPLALFCVLIAFTAAEDVESDRVALGNQMETIADATRTFNKGKKLAAILAREQARLSERVTLECEDDFVYRPIDGVCSNLEHPEWGAPLQALRRLIQPHYNDGKGSPRLRSRTGKILPSARKVSVECFKFDSSETLERDFSQMVMQWGQFIDHDITGTPGTGANNCCAGMKENGKHPDYDEDGPCFPILIEAGDRMFSSDCMEFSRSLPALQRTENCRREQINVLTPHVDGSAVYGGSEEELTVLRDGSTAFMKTSGDNMLPTSNKTVCVKRGIHSCYNAGDSRVNVFPGLTLLHTLWVREHNRLVTELAQINKNWDNETLFQEARKIVIASLQHITYNKYVRLTIGSELYDHFGLSDDFEYDATVNPGIFNSFATAAFRHGHSQIAGHYKVKGDPHKDIAHLYMDTSYVTEGFDDVLLGIIGAANQKTDSKFSEGVSDHLFENTSTPGVSLDLVALNVQRGRDHGLAPYLQYLVLSTKYVNETRFFTSDLKLPKFAIGLFEDFAEIDLYVGGMNEAPVVGGMVGPTFAYIIGEQFRNLRKGDRFWYETKNSTTGFTTDQLAQIKRVTLARVICDNTGKTDIQPDVFRLATAPGNHEVDCDDIPKIDLQKWKE